jgi:hypothetical protein
LEAIYLAITVTPDFRSRLLLYFALVLTAAPAALLFAARAPRRSVLICGALFRATLLMHAPDLSDDLLRYRWDGRVAESGVSPYALKPEHASLSGLRDFQWHEMPHRDTFTIYPPAAQVLFKLGAVSGAPEPVLKAVFAAADLSVAWLLLRFPAGGFAAGLYAAFPLAVIESAGMGHVDSVGIALLLASLLLLRAGNAGTSGVAAALSVLVKYVSGASIPPLLRRGRVAFLASFALSGALFWWAAARETSPAKGLPNFATRWEGNSILYPAVRTVVASTRLAERSKEFYADWKSRRPQRPWMERLWPYFYPEFFSRILLGVACSAGVLVTTWKISDPVRAAGMCIALLLLASPVLQPWYLLWVLPFAALSRSAAFLYLAAAAPLAYALLYRTPYLPAPIVLTLEYVPFAALLVRQVWQAADRAS